MLLWSWLAFLDDFVANCWQWMFQVLRSLCFILSYQSYAVVTDFLDLSLWFHQATWFPGLGCCSCSGRMLLHCNHLIQNAFSHKISMISPSLGLSRYLCLFFARIWTWSLLVPSNLWYSMIFGSSSFWWWFLVVSICGLGFFVDAGSCPFKPSYL